MSENAFTAAPSAVCPQCGSVLAAGVPLGLCRSCVASSWLENLDAAEPEPEDDAPQQFGGFELRGQLGRGGMGVVFLAWQPALQREVALKLVSAGRFAGAEEFQRLRLEAEAVARLNHPNIVAIYEAGEQDGQPWLAMQYVPGGTLSSHLADYPGDPRKAARLLVEIAHAVHHAHQHGVLHRDLKPGNILLDESGRPLVSDFGLARLADNDDGVTLTGRTVGSPAYMAPEAFRGEASVARDVYALGVILYQLLTGRLPFDGPDSPSLIRRCMDEEPPRLRTLRPDIPHDLEVIALKCLEKNPARRYASSQALADDLTRWLEHRPIKARPVSFVVRAAKWTRRHPGGAAAILAVLAGAAAYAVHEAKVARVEAAAEKDVAASRAEAMANLRRAGLESALREVESGFLDQAQRILKDLRLIAPDQAERSPEWSWLWARCQSEGLALVQAHQGEVTAAAFSPDGQTVATAGQDALIHLWKTKSLTSAEAQPFKTIRRPHRSAVIGLAFSPDGARLFTARNGEPRLIEWLTMDGEESGKPVVIRAPRGEWMQTAGLSGKEGRAVISFNGPPGPDKLPAPRLLPATGEPLELPATAAFIGARPDSSAVLAGDFTGGLQLLEPGADGAFAARWRDKRPLYSLTAIAFSPSGRHVAAAHTAATGLPHIQLLRTADGTQFSLTESSGPIRSMAIAGEQWLAAGGDDRVVRLWHLDSPSRCYALPGHMRPVRVVEFSPAGDKLLSGNQGGKIALSDLPRSLLPAAGAPVAATPDLSRVVACGYQDGFPAKEIIVIEPRFGISRRLPAPGIPAAIRFTENGVAVLCQDGDRALRCTLEETAVRTSQTWMLPAKSRIAGMTADGFITIQSADDYASLTLRSYRMESGEVLATKSLPLTPWSTVQFPPDGSRVAVLDAPEGKLVCLTFPSLEPVWQGALRPQIAITWAPDGRKLAWAAGFRAGLLDAGDGRELTEMKQPCETVSRLTFAGPDHLMLSSYDHTVLFISLASQKVTLESRRHPACSELFASADFSLWLSVDLQHRLGWFPWTLTTAPASP